MKKALTSAVILVAMLLLSVSNFSHKAEAATKYNSKQLSAQFAKIAKNSKGVVKRISVAQQAGVIEIDINVNKTSWNKLSSKLRSGTLTKLNKELKADVKNSTVWTDQVKYFGKNIVVPAFYYFGTSSHTLKYYSSI